jgi:hypothetical protein
MEEAIHISVGNLITYVMRTGGRETVMCIGLKFVEFVELCSYYKSSVDLAAFFSFI